MAQSGSVDTVRPIACGRGPREKCWYHDVRGVKRELIAASVISSPADVQVVFADSDKHTKAHFNNSGWLFGELLGHCLGELSGRRWRSVHQVLAPHFSHSKAREYTSLIQEHVLDWTRELHPEEAGSTPIIMRPARELRLLTLRILAEVTYGRLSNEQWSGLTSLVPTRESLLFAAFTRTVPRYSLSRFLPTKTNADLRLFRDAWREWNSEFLQADAGETPTAAVALLRHAVEGGADHREALQTLDEMLFANIDVTLAAAAWCIVAVAKDTVVQAELAVEIERAKQSGKWEAYLQSGSTLLAATVLESGRIQPLAAFSVPQSAPTTRTLSGYGIPAGTDFIVDSHTINLSHDIWGDDSHHFRPSRWLHLSAKEQHAQRYQFWRFGFGPRQCLGKFVVELVLRAIVANLVYDYVITLEDDVNESVRDPTCWIATPIASVSLQKSHRYD